MQQAWLLRLRGKGQNQHHVGNGQSSGKNGSKDPIYDVCRRYNKGCCPFGSGCHIKHRCLYCFKFGHTVLTCRKVAADKERLKHKDRDHRGGGGDPGYNQNHHYCKQHAKHDSPKQHNK